MENLRDCKELSLELMETVDEGVAYICKKFENQNFEAGYSLIHDVAQAVYSINNILRSVVDISNQNSVKLCVENIQEALNNILFKYQEEETNEIMESFNQKFIPEYTQWRKEAFVALNYSPINH